jgi:imidazolonepropionase-like amidohydrolase
VNTVSDYIIKADSILTEKGFEPDKALRMKDGRIVDIYDISVFDDSAELLDFTSYTVTPCFCDYHLHLFRKESTEQDKFIRTLNEYGVFTVLDGGSQDLYSLEIKNTTKNSLEIKSAGHAIYKQCSYGKYIGQVVETVREAEQLIDKLLEAGADYVKIINSGIYNPDNNKISEGGFSPSELKAIVDYGKASGVDVACHANGEQAVEDAVNSGVSYLIHGLEASDKSIAMMAEKGIAFIPTINAFASLKKISKTKEAYDNIDRAVENHMKTVSRAYNEGIKILPGSDSGPDFIPYGSSFHEELIMFQKAGIPDQDILSLAVSRHFEKGSQADFLVLDGLDVMKIFSRGKCIVDNTCPR